MDGFTVAPLAGTDDAAIPFWSPDGRNIGFFADRKLKRIPAAGGAVQTICEAADGRGASWSVDDVIVFAPAPFGGLWKVPAGGGTAEPLTKAEGAGATHRLPWFLPDGKRLLYFSGTQTSDEEKKSAIEALDLRTGRSTFVAHENSEGRYAEPGYLLFIRDGNLLAQRLDPSSLKAKGPATPIAEGVLFEPYRWFGNFTVSNLGLLVFQSNTAQRKRRLTWFDLDGRQLGQVGEAADFFSVTLSPDDRRVASTIRSGASAKPEVRLYDLDRGVGSRFTFGDQGADFPIWSPDGRRIAFGDPGFGVRVKAADGASEAKVVLPERTNIWPLSWSPDGKHMLLRIQDSKTGGVGLWDLALEGDHQPRKLVDSDPDEFLNGSISPDGKWLLYVSNETGRSEIYLVPFAGLGEKRQVSTAGGASGRWLSDRSIVYGQPPDGKLFVVDVDTKGGSLQIGPPHPIFGGRPSPQRPVRRLP